MANTIHPIDETLLDLAVIDRRLLRHFLKDGVLDGDERDILEGLRGERDDLADYNLRRIAHESFERNGNTRRTRDAFKEAGFELVNLDDHRKPANVIQLFPGHDRSAS